METSRKVERDVLNGMPCQRTSKVFTSDPENPEPGYMYLTSAWWSVPGSSGWVGGIGSLPARRDGEQLVMDAVAKELGPGRMIQMMLAGSMTIRIIPLDPTRIESALELHRRMVAEHGENPDLARDILEHGEDPEDEEPKTAEDVLAMLAEVEALIASPGRDVPPGGLEAMREAVDAIVQAMGPGTRERMKALEPRLEPLAAMEDEQAREWQAAVSDAGRADVDEAAFHADNDGDA